MIVNEKISIVIPCYNEEKYLHNNVLKVVNYLNSQKYNYEIILSNDGSDDDTLTVMQGLNEINNKIKICNSSVNHGKGYAVKSGVLKATGDIIFFMDADLSTNLGSIQACMELFQHYDIIIGSRRLSNSYIKQKQPFSRRFIGQVCSTLTNLIIPLNVVDTQCGFKAFKANVAREIFEKQYEEGFVFDVEILYIAKLLKYTIHEVPVIWENDENSKVHIIKDSIIFFLKLFAIRKRKGKYIN